MNQPAQPARQDLFVPSARYPCFRQPVILTSNAERTHLLAFVENRNVSACAPAAASSVLESPDEVGSLLLRRSTDSGKTWMPLQSIYFREGLNIDFLGGVTDLAKGRVWLMVQQGGTVTVFTSDDEGASWSQPKDLFTDWTIKSWSSDIQPKKLKPGCGHGIQVDKDMCASGSPCAEAGRLLIPFVCTNSSASGSHTDKGCTTCLACNLYSDDGGTSWQLGGIGQAGTRESQITQLVSKTSHASLYINERNMGAKPGHRMFARSTDGGKSYDQASFGVDSALTAPVTAHWTGIVAGTSRLLMSSPHGPHGSIAFSGPGSTSARANMTLRVSHDAGASWCPPKSVWEGPAGYSDLTWVGNDSVALIFENGDHSFADRVSVSVIPSAWFIQEGCDAIESTAY